PIRLLHQLLEGLGVTLSKQIAGPLPAENSAGRVAPRRTMVSLVAREEVEKHRRLVEGPFAPSIAAGKYRPEQLLGGGAVEEMLLVGSPLVGIAGGYGDPVDAELGDIIEKGGDALRIRIVEESAIDGDAKALRFGHLQRRDGAVIDPGLTDRFV